MGKLSISRKQADALGIEPYTRHSPLLEKCCLLLSANESYQNAENDLLLLTGLKVGHSTHQRKVIQKELTLNIVTELLIIITVNGNKFVQLAVEQLNRRLNK